jgi:uncharacterized membrane protein
MSSDFLILVLLLVGFLVGGIVAVICYMNLAQRIRLAEREIRRLQDAQAEALRRTWSQTRPATAETPVAPQKPPAPPVSVESPTTPTPELPPSFPPRIPRPVASAREAWSSLEVTIGAKWLNWVGVVLVIVGAMFFLKYAYDNNWIGPAGRIAIAAIAGAGALVLGEKTRRANYPVLFHTLTGGGLALFYGCIYFSFQVYGLTGQPVSFVLAILVTALAVVISVLHNAPGICLLGQLGGFLSPILLSTGTNRPVQLFLFVSILDLATLGCAFKKHWRHVNAAGFIGTWLLYAAWAARFYDVSQIGTALSFSALFFLLFLIAPTFRGLSERRPLPVEDLALVSAGILVEFINNYALLYSDYRAWLGFIVVMQALVLSGLYALWTRHSSNDSKTGQTLLLFTLALVTVAIPIQLRLYAIPIGWSLEALLLGWVGQRYRNTQFQFGAFVATLLAALGLVARLPLHAALFTPVINRPFGSWMTVIVMTFVAAAVLQKNRDRLEDSFQRALPAISWIGAILTCALAHLEISTYWTVRADRYAPDVLLSYKFASLAILWSAIPLVLLWLGRNRYMRFSVPGACAAHVAGILVLLISAVDSAWVVPDFPFLNIQWLSRVLIAVSLWWGSYWMRSVDDRPAELEGRRSFLLFLETAGHVILAALLLVEVNAWISSSRIFSPFMRFGFVSALWSLQALVLIGVGLTTRSQYRRIVGFVIFGITVCKLLLVDMAILQPVYRILSFAATGVLLIVAAYLYQKFTKGLLDSQKTMAQAAGRSTQ